MPIIAEPAKTFNFAVSLFGIDQFLVQEVSGLGMEIEEVIHGGPNQKVKTAGLAQFKDITMKKLVRNTLTDNEMWRWLQFAQNTALRTGGLYSGVQGYARTFTIRQLSPLGVTTKRFQVEGWVKSFTIGEFNRTSSENTMEEVIIAVNQLDIL